MANNMEAKNDDFVSQGQKEYGHKVPIFNSQFLKDAKKGDIISDTVLLKIMEFLTKYAKILIPLAFVMPLFNGGYIYIVGVVFAYILLLIGCFFTNKYNSAWQYNYAYFRHDLQSYGRIMDNLNIVLPKLKMIEKIHDREERETAYYRYVMELDQKYGKGHHLFSVNQRLIEEEKKEKEQKWNDEVERRKEIEKGNPNGIRSYTGSANCYSEMKPYVDQAVMEYKEALKVLEETEKDLGFRAEVNIRANAKIEKERPHQLKVYQYSKDKKLKKKMDPYDLFSYDPDWENKIREDFKYRSMQEEVDCYVRLIKNLLDEFRDKFGGYSQLPIWDDRYKDYRNVESVINVILYRLQTIHTYGYYHYYNGTGNEQYKRIIHDYEAFGKLNLVHPEISALQYSNARYDKEKADHDRKKRRRT